MPCWREKILWKQQVWSFTPDPLCPEAAWASELLNGMLSTNYKSSDISFTGYLKNQPSPSSSTISSHTIICIYNFPPCPWIHAIRQICNRDIKYYALKMCPRSSVYQNAECHDSREWKQDSCNILLFRSTTSSITKDAFPGQYVLCRLHGVAWKWILRSQRPPYIRCLRSQAVFNRERRRYRVECYQELCKCAFHACRSEERCLWLIDVVLIPQVPGRHACFGKWNWFISQWFSDDGPCSDYKTLRRETTALQPPFQRQGHCKGHVFFSHPYTC